MLVSRHLNINVAESDDEDMVSTAEREAERATIDALTIPWPVSSWYSDANNTKLWTPNTMVSVISPTLSIPDGFDFLIRSVEYEYSDDGTRAKLGLVPPQIYTGEPLEIWNG